MMSLVCHYHIVKPHLNNEGFEAVLIVIFKRDLPHIYCACLFIDSTH